MRAGWLAVLVVLLGMFVRPRTARADEVAPDLESADLRVLGQGELKRQLLALPDNDRRRLAGIYVAFDPSNADPIAQVACDDDGDYVVVVSDAMLRLAAHIARADTYDERNASDEKVQAYASFLARSQVPGRRLLPPPPGSYIAAQPAATYDDRLADVLAFVVGHELTRLRAGDLVCPKPTATKESGDDVWTGAEQRRAAEAAASVYPGRQLERDAESIVRLRASGRTERGALALLRFFTQFDTERAIALGRFSTTYGNHHPGGALRLANVKRVVKSLEDERNRD
jgi:hypothetical protein